MKIRMVAPAVTRQPSLRHSGRGMCEVLSATKRSTSAGANGSASAEPYAGQTPGLHSPVHRGATHMELCGQFMAREHGVQVEAGNRLLDRLCNRGLLWWVVGTGHGVGSCGTGAEMQTGTPWGTRHRQYAYAFAHDPIAAG